MDTKEAREHLEMVDRILTSAQKEPIRPVPGLIVAWGIAAALIDTGDQLALSHIGGPGPQALIIAALAAGGLYSVGVSISMARNCRFERISVTEMRMGRVMGAVWFTVLVAAFAQPYVFGGWGGAAVWSMGAAMMMLMIGFDGDKRGLAGGLMLLASVLAANYAFHQVAGYVLAAGFLFGYAVPGLLFALQPPRETA